jgi:hypothetical protein
MCALRTAACAVVAVLVLAGCDDRKPSTTRATHVGHGLTVELPPGWQTSKASLTPNLGPDPSEVLAAANYPLRYRPRDCAQVPVSALEDLGESGAFVELEERRDAGAQYEGEFPPRPEHFGASLGGPSEASDCAPRVRMSEHWFGFTDNGRHFYALVAFGSAASEDAQDDAWALLDSLTVDDR